jgi:hypothetical protein
LQISRRQDERCHASPHERQSFNVSISDSMIFGQDDPSVLPDLG